MFIENNQRIVCKFGGSSLADADGFKRARDILLADDRRKTVVVSAPGKITGDDEKVTDLLYAYCLAVTSNENADGIFDKIRSRFFSVKEELSLKYPLEEEFYKLKNEPFKGIAYTVSRGEYLCAALFSEYSGYAFIDAADIIFFDYSGKADCEKTENAIKKSNLDKVVTGGFYGRGGSGEIRLFSRGGSDVTGALIAAYTGAAVYEKWTDVSGLYERDPNLFKGQSPILNASCAKLEDLCKKGAGVLSAEAVAQLKNAGVTLKILNTFRPEDKGTTIR